MNNIQTTITKQTIVQTFVLSPQDIINEAALELINRNTDVCIPITVKKKRGVSLQGNIEGMIPLDFYCKKITKARDFYEMLCAVNRALIGFEARKGRLANIDFEPSRVYVNPKLKSVRFLCWPVVNFEPEQHLKDFYKNLLHLCSFRDVEQENILSHLREYVNRPVVFDLNNAAVGLNEIASRISGDVEAWGTDRVQNAWQLQNANKSSGGLWDKLFGKPAMTITYSSFTDRGDRNNNEDSIRIKEKDESYCFVLADGLGGHGMGDVASMYAVGAGISIFDKAEAVSLDTVKDSIQAAQDLVIAEQMERHVTRKMKTTLVELLIANRQAYVGFIGDSRLYHFRNNEVKSRTLDHSVPQVLALAGDIKESEIRNHKERSCLLKVVGVEWEEPEYELWKPLKIKPGDAFLLCSDGFWELIVEEKMCALLSTCGSVSEWLHEMLQVVQKNGEGVNMDNYSAIAVWVN